MGKGVKNIMANQKQGVRAKDLCSNILQLVVQLFSGNILKAMEKNIK